MKRFLIILNFILFSEIFGFAYGADCFTALGCPWSYDNICATNGDCYLTFRSECDMKQRNSYPSEEKKFKLVDSGKCESNSKYRPLCKIADYCGFCTADVNPNCAYSCKNYCYKTFPSNCDLMNWNCYNLNDYYSYFKSGECGVYESCK